MKLFFSFTTLIIFVITSTAQVATGRKVAHIVNNGSYVFDADTTVIKKEWALNIFDVKDIQYNKIEILKDVTFDNLRQEFYMLVAYDSAKKLKTAQWLIKRGYDLYFARYTDYCNDENLFFYLSLFTVYGSDDKEECFPRVYYGKTYKWAGSKNPDANTNSTCAGLTRSLPREG